MLKRVPNKTRHIKIDEEILEINPYHAGLLRKKFIGFAEKVAQISKKISEQKIFFSF